MQNGIKTFVRIFGAQKLEDTPSRWGGGEGGGSPPARRHKHQPQASNHPSKQLQNQHKENREEIGNTRVSPKLREERREGEHFSPTTEYAKPFRVVEEQVCERARKSRRLFPLTRNRGS